MKVRKHRKINPRFNILREMEETSSEGKKFSVSGQFSLDVEILKTLIFSGLASYGYTNNREESVLGRESYAAFEDRLSFDKNNNTQNLYVLYPSLLRTGNNITYADIFHTRICLRIIILTC